MIKNIIRYVGLALVIVGIVLVMKNLFETDTNNWNSKNFKNNLEAKTYYQANIKLLDEETNEYIVGSNLVLKNEEEEIIDEWTTKENKHTILKLEKGTYTLEQLETIDGYEKSDNTITFEITSEDKEIVMYNKAKEKQTSNEVNVDNTLSTKSYITIVVALITLLTGIKLIVFPNKNY